MSNRNPSAVLERRTYRLRRLMDAARLLPLLGLLLFLLPLIWANNDSNPAATSRGVMYVFSVWAGLIVAAVLLARKLPRSQDETPENEPPK